MTDEYKGFFACLLAYLLWGLAPIFFKLFGTIDALQIIAHRIVWGLVFLVIFLLLRDGRELFNRARISLRQFFWLVTTGTLIAVNWLVFIWAVNHDQILATSFGYFITPLFQIFLGIFFLKERITPVQMFSLIIAMLATVYLAISIGSVPWIALTLAISFSTYGLIRKKLAIRPLVGLAWETALMTPLALYYLLLGVDPSSVDTGEHSQLGLWILFISAGLVTVLPLIAFNYAAARLKLSTIGFMQYLAPSMSFLIAVFIYNEPFSNEYKIAFCSIWAALAILSIAPVLRQFSTKHKQ